MAKRDELDVSIRFSPTNRSKDNICDAFIPRPH
jgi:hypothetical protein